MSAHVTDPLTATPLVAPTIRRLGERTCVINVGTDLRHIELPAVEEAVRGLMHEDCIDLVFDLTYLRRYETFALVRLAREWDRLAESGCAVHVAAREARVISEAKDARWFTLEEVQALPDHPHDLENLVRSASDW